MSKQSPWTQSPYTCATPLIGGKILDKLKIWKEQCCIFALLNSFSVCDEIKYMFKPTKMPDTHRTFAGHFGLNIGPIIFMRKRLGLVHMTATMPSRALELFTI